jgi:hypothetical protein
MPTMLMTLCTVMTEADLGLMRDVLFEDCVMNKLKKAKAMKDRDLEILTQTAENNELANLLGVQASQHSDRLMAAIHNNQSQLRITFEPHQDMDNYMFTQRHGPILQRKNKPRLLFEKVVTLAKQQYSSQLTNLGETLN